MIIAKKQICKCPPQFAGRRCQVDLCNCQCSEGDNPCICHVPPPQECNANSVHTCKSGMCLNGGTCVVIRNEPVCKWVLICLLEKITPNRHLINLQQVLNKIIIINFPDRKCVLENTFSIKKMEILRNKYAICWFRCSKDWGGLNCSTPLESNPCLDYCVHGGVCTVSSSQPYSPTCHCLPEWTGMHCDIRASCVNFCFNGGTCQESPDSDFKPSCL